MLGVPNEAALEEVAARLARAGADFVRIVENAGRYAGQLTALGVRPGRKEVVGKPLRGLKPIRELL